MKFHVTIDVSASTGTRMDSQAGGPGPFIGHIVQRFQPEAFYVALDRRTMFLVIGFPGEKEMGEFMAYISSRFDTYPVMTPVSAGAEFAAIAAHIRATVPGAP
ncbi:MAG: hypothetical protein HUU14_08660 [Dehalococcoidia bacterium]|nr:MAG: hypothetical protein EDM76_11980 [bacterium]MCE7927644.1 hypothetical protein [Chloroflexi bacterium CFX7]MCK6566030.1 hypothetical protein [Dehalococcoidia bacterium]MCL4230516.1 hypothetical protein [Dehalococcoidia bacterium]NUQ55939.1 hypothetical protein [Dehalococcoidia bacterium]